MVGGKFVPPTIQTSIKFCNFEEKFTDVCMVGGKFVHTNIHKILQLCGDISVLVFNK